MSKTKTRTAVAKLGFRDTEKKPIMQSNGVLIASTLTGAFTGAVMGRPSLYSGIATTALGWVSKVPVVTHFGMGMMMSGGYQLASGLNGRSLAGVKERIKAIGEDFKQRLYLDKILKPSADVPQIEGVGSVQYFKYPSQNSLDMSAVEKIERELAESAKRYQQQQMNGVYDEDRIF